MGARLLYLLRNERIPRDRRILRPALRLRGTGVVPTTAQACALSAQENRHPAPSSADYIRAQSSPLHQTGALALHGQNRFLLWPHASQRRRVSYVVRWPEVTSRRPPSLLYHGFPTRSRSKSKRVPAQELSLPQPLAGSAVLSFQSAHRRSRDRASRP